MITLRGITEAFFGISLGIIIATVASCSTVNPRLTEKELVSYKNEFLALTKYSESDFNYYSVKFMSLTDPTVGLCNVITREIVIDPAFWYSTTSMRRQALIFHEFGHCICNIGHVGDVRKDACPLSIMYPHLPSEKCLDKYWVSYVTDFLKRCE